VTANGECRSADSNINGPEPAYTAAGWYPEVQQEFIHGQSPWSPFTIVGRGSGVGTTEEGGRTQTMYPCEISLDIEDGDNQVL
jgi:hypothetical protein